MRPTKELLAVRPGVELDVQACGEANAPTVVLISGAGAPAAFWPDSFVQRLTSPGLGVVRYDHRDTGRSTHFDDPYSIDELLLDLQQLVAQLGAERIHLVGHSMGGYLAQMACLQGWPSLASITSISAGSAVDEATRARLGISSPDEAVWAELMKNQTVGDCARDLPGWLASWGFLNGSRPFDEDMATRYTRSLYRGDPRNAQVATNHIHAMSTVPPALAEGLPTARLPALVLHGEEDPLVPIDNGQATAKLIADSTFHSLDGAGHMFFDPGAWDEIADRLLAFVV